MRNALIDLVPKEKNNYAKYEICLDIANLSVHRVHFFELPFVCTNNVSYICAFFANLTTFLHFFRFKLFFTSNHFTFKN